MLMLEQSAAKLLELGILGGSTPKRILRSVNSMYLKAKADQSHIRFHALQLKREGALTDIEAQPYLTFTLATNTEPSEPPVSEPKRESRGRSRKPRADKPARRGRPNKADKVAPEKQEPNPEL